MCKILLLSLCNLILVLGQGFEGDSCSKSGRYGVCTNLRNCQSAINDIRNRQPPQICSFDGSDPVVCCLDNTPTTTRRPVATTTRRTTTTTEYVPQEYDYKTNDEVRPDGCVAVAANLTAPKTGRKAWDKCIDYQEQYIYPCEKGVALTGALSRANHCGHNADQLIVGGADAAKGEFPHMALLGFGEQPSIQFLCGGSIISEKFILTAGHCTSARDIGPLTYAAIGLQKRTDPLTADTLYQIQNIIKHPQYLPPSKYNDIALLETRTAMKLNRYAVPACLDVGAGVNPGKASASGWGAIEYRGGNADVMQKVILTKFTTEECAAKFPTQRLMTRGFDDQTQLCYGDKTKSKDTCQGDSGGPLQVKNTMLNCMYTIVGVTSFGRACGFIGEPGIYTRVAAYVPWIESIVWS